MLRVALQMRDGYNKAQIESTDEVPAVEVGANRDEQEG